MPESKAAKEQKARELQEIGTKLEGLLQSQQAQDAGFEDVGLIEENDSVTVGVVIDGENYFLELTRG